MPAPWIAVLLLLFDAPAKAEVEVESLKLDPAALKAMDQVELKVMERGQSVTYRGVPLAALLGDRISKGPKMSELRALSGSVLLVRAEDDYQIAVSAVAAAMDTKGSRYLLALTRDGEPLGKGQGPVKLIVPGDPEHVRWIRMISAVDLVTLPRPKVKAGDSRSR